MTHNKMKRLIVDCDVGTDDALALLILLKAEQSKLIKIEAICCSMGNTSLENVCKNVIRLLEITKRTDIPVYKGSPNELIKRSKLKTLHHGTDGFGDFFQDSPNTSLIKDEASSNAMYQIAKKYPKDLYLMLLGPLTNAALAMKMYPDFPDLIKEIYIMGGNYKAVGNISKAAEYNFYVDPEAAYIVLNEARCPITLLPYETCLKPKIPHDWAWDVLGKSTNEAVQMLITIEKELHKTKKVVPSHFRPCDAFVAAAFVRPDCIEKSEKFSATVELHGYETRGQLVLDHKKYERENTTIITKIHREKFMDILLETST